MKQTPQIKLVRKREWKARRRPVYTARCQLGGSGQGACAKPMIGVGWDLDQMTATNE